MSKKSRKRNKKILGALAAGLGAMALMKRKKAASVASSDEAGLNVTHPALSAKNWIAKKTDAAPILPDPKPVVVSPSDIRGPHGAGGGKGAILTARRRAKANAVPPSMRSGSPVAEGYQRKKIIGVNPNRTKKWGWTGEPVDNTQTNMSSYYKGGGIAKRGKGVALKSGGRVTGIAKRGFGRALMKGKK